ncbi:hypothetical protein DL767_001221 [Monosporascus sp. MG133]|nr:hypothetical protein DL767_001221 [Monosporascus sp. MG133]
MGKKKSKDQAIQAGNGPIAGPSLPPENDTTKPVFRLTPIIRSRLSRNFDAESYTQPSQKAINKIVYVLFLPYLAAAASRPLSQFDIYRLVLENHAEAMSHIWSETSAGETSFRVGRGPDTVKIESPAVKAVRAMPVVTVAYHVWTLWTLGAFSVHSVRQTFIGALTDTKLPKAFQMSLGRKAVLNRICFDAFRPFTESIPGGLQSKADIAKIVQQNFGALKDSMHALLASLDVEYKGRTTGAAGWSDQNMISKLHVLWEDGVFTSGLARQKPLAPPLNYRRKAVTSFIPKLAQRERNAMLIHGQAIRRQALGIEEQQMASSGPSLKCESLSPPMKVAETIPREELVSQEPSGSHSMPQRDDLASGSGITPFSTNPKHQKRLKRLKRQGMLLHRVYLEAIPFMKPYLHKKLDREAVAEIVRGHRKSQGYLGSVRENKAIKLVYCLWTERAFHDKRRRRMVTGVDTRSPTPTDHSGRANNHGSREDPPLPVRLPNNHGIIPVRNTTPPSISGTVNSRLNQASFTVPTRQPQFGVISKCGAQHAVSSLACDPIILQSGVLLGKPNTGPARPREIFSGQQTFPLKVVGRSLDTLYEDNPGTALGHVKQTTLELSATVIQQVAEEAAFEWLRCWCPSVDWADVIHQEGRRSGIGAQISIPREAAVGNDSLSMPELLRKCRRVCKEAEGPIEVNVIETVGNAIQFCRVLKDEKRRVSLEKAENEIRAISSSLDIRAAGVKRRVSEELEAFNKSVQKGIPTYFQSPSFRQVKERAILDEAQRDFEKFRETSSMKLLGVLKQLLDSSHEAYPIS